MFTSIRFWCCNSAAAVGASGISRLAQDTTNYKSKCNFTESTPNEDEDLRLFVAL